MAKDAAERERPSNVHDLLHLLEQARGGAECQAASRALVTAVLDHLPYLDRQAASGLLVLVRAIRQRPGMAADLRKEIQG
jgi:hypothetical protein